jgi:hypothetical protein
MNDNTLEFSDTLHLITRNVYGRVLVYPNCGTSEKLIELTRRKTFDEIDLEVLKRLGFLLVLTPSL